MDLRWSFRSAYNRTSSKGKRQNPAKQEEDLTLVHQFLNAQKKYVNVKPFGHWELDTVVSGRGKAKGCVATFIERMTRWYVGILIPDRSAQSMERAVRLLHTNLPKGAIKQPQQIEGKNLAAIKC